MTQALKWICVNGVFWAALYFGLHEGVEGAANIAMFIAWTGAICSVFFLSDEVVRTLQKKGLPTVPLWTDQVIDLVVIAAMVWHGWFWTSIAVLVNHVFMYRLHQDITEHKGGKA